MSLFFPMIPPGEVFVPNELCEFILRAARVGSRIICNPAPTNTDEDWLLLVDTDIEVICELANKMGFTINNGVDNTYPDDSDFVSVRGTDDYDNINWIITSSEEFYKNFMMATRIAKELNLLEKPKRLSLFQAILYQNYGFSNHMPEYVKGGEVDDLSALMVPWQIAGSM